MGEMKWYYSKNDNREGPIDESSLKEMFLSRELPINTLVWNDGMKDWQSADIVEQFRDIKPIVPPPLPRVGIVQHSIQTKPIEPPPLPMKPVEPPLLPIKPDKLVSQKRPWVRFFARGFDYAIFMYIVLFAYLTIKPTPPSNPMSDIFFISILLCFLWIFIEPIFLTLFGCTIGKGILNTAVYTDKGTKLSFGQAVKRSFKVWLVGEGLCLPIITFFTQYSAYKTIRNFGIAYWDGGNGTFVKHKKIGILRVVVFIILLLLGQTLYITAVQSTAKINTSMKEGNFWMNLGYSARAIKIFDEVIKSKPRYAEAYNYRGFAEYNAGMYNEALQDFNKSIELDNNSETAFNNRGLAHHAIGDYDKAIDDYSRAIELKPDYPYPYNNKGMSLLSIEKYNEALFCFNKAIVINDTCSVAYRNRAVCYTHMDSTINAIVDYTNAIKCNPNYALAYNGRGCLYIFSGKTEKAIHDFTKSLEIDTTNAIVYMNRATVFMDNNDERLAIKDVIKAARLGDALAKNILVSRGIKW